MDKIANFNRFNFTQSATYHFRRNVLWCY